MLFIFLFVVEIYFTATVFLQSGLSIDSKNAVFSLEVFCSGTTCICVYTHAQFSV